MRRSPTTASVPDRTARRARTGVSLLFVTNAVVYASVVPRFPQLKAELALSNTQLGLAIAAGPVGSLVAGSVASLVITRFGSARAGVLASALMSLNLLVIGSAQSVTWLAAGLFVAGFCDAVGDVADNLHGLRVQRRYGRSIINGFHGAWSVGAVTGGLLGSLAAGLGIPVLAQLGVLAAVFAVVSLGSSRLLLPGSDVGDRGPEHDPVPGRSRALSRSVVRTVLAMGGVAALAGVVEDAGASWGAVYLSGSLGTGAGLAGAAFLSMAVCMSVGRLSGDRFVNVHGERAVARVGCLLAAAGMGSALALPTPLTTVVGFGLAGLGTATVIPAAMHAADGVVGLRAGVALTAVSLLTRIGFLLSPPLVGALADATSLRAALVVVPVAALGAAAAAQVLRSRVGAQVVAGSAR